MKHIFTLTALLFATFTLSAQCVSGDCKNGKGIYVYPSGARYVGHFQNGEIHGIGTCTYSDGTVYRGNWQNRYPEGRGTKVYANGMERTGLWKKGFPIDEAGNVQEEFMAKNGDADANIDIQTGCLNGDCKNGEGVYAYADGSKYEGLFTNGKIEGQGTFFFPNGDKYVGQFLAGYSHGEGTLYHADGTRTTGKWHNGEYVNDMTNNYAEVGCISGDCQSGEGIYVYDGKDAKYQGYFQNNKPHGQGFIEYTNGETYRGTWANGQFNGEGTLTLLDGSRVSGLWKDGAFQAAATMESPATKSTMPPKQLKEVDLATIRNNSESKVYAVVIGVASYHAMPPLRYTDDDAYRMLAHLRSPEGGALPESQVRILVDEAATKENITTTMRELYGQADENDLVLLYFSGHGVRGAFLPIDFDGFNNKLEHDEINEILDASDAQYKLCIADACHSGGLHQIKSGSVTNTLTAYYESLAQALPGTALIMSSKAEETSLESNNLRQGVFSHFLLRGMKGEADTNFDQIIDVQELYDFVGDNVKEYTQYRQSPVILGDYDARMPVAAVRR
ncbi:MAG: caspase family protein [Saprospiraceae bacterium]